MSKKKLAIIGNGMGTCRLLDELVARGAAFQYEITVFGEEQGGAYNRIMLGKVLAARVVRPPQHPAHRSHARHQAGHFAEAGRNRRRQSA
jgi:hypothetical protein